MRVFVAGATGAIGRPLVRRLAEAGHDVVGTTRSESKAAWLGEQGAEAVVLDAFDVAALRDAVETARPDVVVNQLTALSEPFNPRKYAKWIAETNRLRAEVGPALVDAARSAGARRVIAQSISFLLKPGGARVVDETAPANTDAPEPIGSAVRSAIALERAVTGAEGIEGLVLRYGYFYGPGTSYGPDGDITNAVRARRFPLIGSGQGVFSFVHVEDAAAATVLALDRGSPGVFNVVDDEPAAYRDWVPVLAEAAGAPPPRRVPTFLARLAAGSHTVVYAIQQPGASNAKAKRELGFEPEYPTWRDGFAASLRPEGVKAAA